VTLEQLTDAKEQDLAKLMVPMRKALDYLPKLAVEDQLAKAISCGNSITMSRDALADTLIAQQLVRLEKDNVLFALAVVQDVPNLSEQYMLQPVKVLV